MRLTPALVSCTIGPPFAEPVVAIGLRAATVAVEAIRSGVPLREVDIAKVQTTRKAQGVEL